MSSAWEILDKESKAHQDEVAAWEFKFHKLSVEVFHFLITYFNYTLNADSCKTQKAKAEQKYFAAMREKEAIDAERKAVLKNAMKYATTITKLTEQEKLLQDEAVRCFCDSFCFER